jgi:hypothetical protein
MATASTRIAAEAPSVRKEDLQPDCPEEARPDRNKLPGKRSGFNMLPPHLI